MRVVGVPVGKRTVSARFLTGDGNGESAELVKALVLMQDTQASFQNLRLFATSRLAHLLRTVPPSITCQADASYDALVGWALASIIAGDGAAAAGLPTPEEVAHNPTVCQNQIDLGQTLRQAHLPIREGGLGLTEGKRSQKEDAVGSSWASLAAEEDSQNREIETVLVELSQTKRGVGGVCVGVVPRVQLKLLRALYAHQGETLLQDIQTQKRTAMKIGMVRLRGAREKGAMTFVECLGISQEDTMEGPL